MAYRFKNTIEVESSVCPGVVFTLRKITDGRRHDFNQQIAEKQKHLADLKKAAEEPDNFEAGVELDKYLDQMQYMRIRWACAKVDGLELDEGPGTLDNLKDWPTDLRMELIAIIVDQTVLNEASAKNFGPRITFGEVVARKTNASIASNADAQSTGTTATETAPDTSRS